MSAVAAAHRGPDAGVVLAIIAFALRLAFFLRVGAWDPQVANSIVLVNDAAGYHQLAVTMLDAHRFAYAPTAQADFMRTPLYPAWVAMLYATTGRHPWVVLLSHLVLDALTVLLIHRIARRAFGERAAIFAAGLYAVDPLMLLYSNMMLSETLFFFLLTLAYALVQPVMLDDGAPAVKPKRLVDAGAAFGLAVLTRPVAMYLPFVMAPFFVFGRRDWLRGLGRFALVAAVMFAFAFPWMARNHRIYGAYSMSFSGPFQLLAGAVAPVVAERDHIPLQAAWDQVVAEAAVAQAREAGHMDDPVVKSRYWKATAFDYIRRYPVAFAKNYAKGCAYSLVNLRTSGFALMLRLAPPPAKTGGEEFSSIAPPPSAWASRSTPVGKLIAGLVALHLLVTYVAIAIGAIVALRNPRWRRWALFSLVVAAYYVALAGLGYGEARYRIPGAGLYLPLAGLGIATLWKGRAATRS